MSKVRVQSAYRLFISTEVTTSIQTPHCGLIPTSRNKRKPVVKAKSSLQGAIFKHIKLLEEHTIF